MALDRNRLYDDIVAAMQRQMPDGESVSAESRQFASDLANAIRTYVEHAEVVDVRVRAEDGTTLDQTGTGELR